MRQDNESGASRSQEHPEISPRLRAATRLRFAALGGFEPSQARLQQAPLVGAVLLVVLPSVAAWAAMDHQQAPVVGAALEEAMASVAVLAALNLPQTPAWVAHVALQWVWPKLWLDPQQTLGEVAPLAMVASVAAALAA